MYVYIYIYTHTYTYISLSLYIYIYISGGLHWLYACIVIMIRRSMILYHS